MGRRKRAITVAINNLNAKKAKKAVKDQQTNAREQSLVEDDGEIVLWDDVLVEESEEEMEDTSEDREAVEGEGCSDWWRAESVQKEMVVRRKYERIPS